MRTNIFTIQDTYLTHFEYVVRNTYSLASEPNSSPNDLDSDSGFRGLVFRWSAGGDFSDHDSLSFVLELETTEL